MPDGDYFVHPSSCVEEGARIGRGTRVWHFCHLMSGAVVGDDCSIGQGCMVASGAVLGIGVRLQNHVSVCSGVTIEDDAFIGPGCVFTNVRIPRAFIRRRDHYVRTLIGQGAALGAGSVILCGIRVGRYAMTGAGSVVTRDVPDYVLVYGNPARFQGWVCRCGQPLGAIPPDICPACGRQWEGRSSCVTP
jgi:UDP-2-acetamido-3-amino-2,3-dideoxy-glucuronate N-acetyltransferase